MAGFIPEPKSSDQALGINAWMTNQIPFLGDGATFGPMAEHNKAAAMIMAAKVGYYTLERWGVEPNPTAGYSSGAPEIAHGEA